MSETTVIVLVVLSVCAFGYAGWVCVHTRMNRVFWGMVAAVAAAAGGLFAAAMSAPGWDALIYAVLLVIGAAPAGTALMLGGGLGYLTRPKYLMPS